MWHLIMHGTRPEELESKEVTGGAPFYFEVGQLLDAIGMDRRARNEQFEYLPSNDERMCMVEIGTAPHRWCGNGTSEASGLDRQQGRRRGDGGDAAEGRQPRSPTVP